MKKKFSALISLISVLAIFQISAHDKNQVLETYKEIRSKKFYIDTNGKSIPVVNMKYACIGMDCKIVVNDKELSGSEIKINFKETTIEPPAKQNPEPPKKEPQPGQAPSNHANGNEPENMKTMTEFHNQIRREKKLPDLVWDSQLAGYAQEWADYLKTKNCNPTYRPAPNKYGENIAWAMGWNMNPENVVKMWTEAEKDFNYQNNTCAAGKVCGNYTQIIWKNTKRLGCGMSACSGTEIWVCNYDPPGNQTGEKPF